MVQGTRTHAQQGAVYAQGRTTPGAIVTDAEPGDSFHQYGLAGDVVPLAYKALPNWNPSGPLWAKIGAIGESLGLTWGGRWSKPDRPHFHLDAAPLVELKAYWDKFKQIMPITVTPTTGALGVILVLGILYWFFMKPQLERIGWL